VSEVQKKPLEFANKVIRQMMDHLFSDDIVSDRGDFLVIRTIFRFLGGKWEKVVEGDVVHLVLLSKVVAAWGNLPGRSHHSDDLY